MEDFEKFTTLMYRPPEMIDKYKKYSVNFQADIWVSGLTLLIYFIDARLCALQHLFLLAPFLGCAKASNRQWPLLHAQRPSNK